MKPEDCPKLDECYKIKMILDKDLLDFQYAESILVPRRRKAGAYPQNIPLIRSRWAPDGGAPGCVG